MDSKSGSLGVGKLISNEQYSYSQNAGIISGNIYSGNVYSNSENTNYYHFNERSDVGNVESKRLARQVIEEAEDTEINISILQEVQAHFNESSESFPPSVKAALKSCITRQRSLAQCRDELSEKEEEVAKNKDKLSRSEIKEYQISFLVASQSFRKAVLLFRELIIGSRETNNIIIYGNIHRTSNFKGRPSRVEEEPVHEMLASTLGDMGISTPRPQNVNLVHQGNSYSTNNTRIDQTTVPASNTSLGQSVRQVLDTWSITFSAGVQDGIPRWHACRGIPDTGANGNWIRRDVLQRARIEPQIREFDGPLMAMEDASNILHVADTVITLTWYRNEEAESTTTDFFVLETGPYEFWLGREFVYERFEREFGENWAKENLEDNERPHTLLPGKLRPMTSAEKLQHDIDKATKARERAKAAEERRKKKADELAEQRQHLTSVVGVHDAGDAGSIATTSTTATDDSKTTQSSG